MDDKRVSIYEFEKEVLGIQEQKNILKFRNYWSPRIFILVGGILVFQASFVVAIGLGILDYFSYQSVVSVYLGESVIQVFGLGIIVLKFLFPKNHK